MKLGRNTERDYFKQEMLMNNNNKKNQKGQFDQMVECSFTN